MADLPTETGLNAETESFSLEVLEFGDIVELVGNFLSGPLSEPLLHEVLPHTAIDRIRRDHALTAEAREYARENPRPSLGSLADPRSILDKLAIEGDTCTAFEILALVELARAARDHRSLFQKTPFDRLHMLAGGMADFRELVAELDGKILPDGSVDSSASAALRAIRRSIERLRADIQSTLEKLLRRHGQSGALQDAVITIRSDRFVLPVRAEEKHRVEGIVHGSSSSGATLFVEPMETVPLNNDLVEQQDREFAEVQRILGEFTAKLRLRRDDLIRATGILSELDLVFARAEFARQYDCCLPEFLTGLGDTGGARELILAEVRHPLLEKSLRRQGRHPVPLTLELKEPKALVIISGPNTGGKTVALKTVAVAALMAQSGLPVCAAFARLPVFDRVLADIGDQQSIQANLSTFSAHVRNIQSMAAMATARSLVLMDELGGSTDPNEGAALAVAILEHFRARGSIALVTTHHSRLKAYAAETPEAVNAAMEFDEATLQPTYRVLVGLPGKSSGIDIAQRLGLDQGIVAKARSLLDPAEAEAAALVTSLHEQKSRLEHEIASLEQSRQELAAREKQLQQEFERERRAKLKDLDRRLDETLRQSEDKWEKTVAEIRAQIEAAARAQGSSKAAIGKAARGLERKVAGLERETREEWNSQVLEALGTAPQAAEAVAATVDRQPAVGDRVRVDNLPMPGTVTAVREDGQLEVEVGRMRMRLDPGEVQVLLPGSAGALPALPSAAGIRSGWKGEATERQIDVPPEINVIGTTADEARDLVDKYLDQAFLAGKPRLRVIHGFGKGILRKTLHELFTGHAQVDKFYPAPPQEGGAGATIVEMKI